MKVNKKGYKKIVIFIIITLESFTFISRKTPVKDDILFLYFFISTRNASSFLQLKKIYFNKIGIEGSFLNLINNIYKKSTVNIILTGEKLEVFPPRSGMRQGWLL